jgi:hypothetical protein
MRSLRPITVACRRGENSARERSGKEIQQRPLGFMADRLRDVVPPRRNDETGKILRDAWSVQHGAVPNVCREKRKRSPDAAATKSAASDRQSDDWSPAAPIVARSRMT